MMTLMPAMMIKMMMKIVGKNQKERPPEMQRYSMGKWLTFFGSRELPGRLSQLNFLKNFLISY